MTRFLEFDTREAASEQLAARIAERLRDAITKRGAATLALCGGTSPVRLFEDLRTRDLPWSQVTIVATDERWISPTQEQSNEGLLRRLLFRERAAAAHLVSLYVDCPTPTSGLPIITRRLAAMASPFDAVVLGMGIDGHTASLIPDATNIDAMLGSQADCVVPLFDDDRIKRISLGPARLLATRALYLLLFGVDKRRVHDQALEPGPAHDLPVRLVLNQTRVLVTSYWAP